MMWKTAKASNGDIHVLPSDDRASHTRDRKCQCKPRLLTARGSAASPASPNKVVVVHHDPSEGRNVA